MDFSDRQQEPGKKFIGLGLVLAFHVVLLYALLNGLGNKIVQIIQKPMETKIVEEVKPPPPPPDTPPPPPPKLLAPPPPFIPPPEVQVQQQPQQNTISAVSNVKPDNPVFAKTQQTAPPEPAKATGPVTVPGVIDFNVSGCKPEYPRASLRNEETGTVVLSVLIGADGAVSDVKIDKSSGFRGLDNAVRAQLMSGSCKNKPGTVDGKPQATWTKVQYVWKLD
ncbi:energy transducer TonB, partial [Undibacterium sp. SXout20W]|uniref:energy transducer TonB n=1 Tax=Undibacterium sp. SXout20W TaxID=3413051 RepID=UPI003BF011BA